MTVQQAIEEFIARMVSAGISLEDTHSFIDELWPEESQEEE